MTMSCMIVNLIGRAQSGKHFSSRVSLSGMGIGMIQILIPIKIPLFEILPIPMLSRIFDHTDSNSN